MSSSTNPLPPSLHIAPIPNPFISTSTPLPRLPYYLFQCIIQHSFTHLNVSATQSHFYDNLSHELTANMTLSPYKFLNAASSSVLDIDIDNSEMRYLICASTDFTVRIYDLDHSGEAQEPGKREVDETQGTEADKEKPPASAPPRNTSPITTIPPLVTKNLSQANSRHKYAIASVQWYPIDTGIFITGSFDHTLRVWDTNSMTSVRRCRFREKVYKVCMSRVPSGPQIPLICVGTGGREVSCVDIRSGNVAVQFMGHRDAIWALDWHPKNPHLLVSGSLDGTVRLWDIRKVGMLVYYDMNHTTRSKKEYTFHKFSTDNFSSKTKVPQAHAGGVTALQFTNDGQRIISTGVDESIRMWDVTSGTNLLVPFEEVKNKNRRSHKFALDPQDNHLYFPVDNKIHLYDLESGELLRKMEGHYSHVNTCIFHPRDLELYSCGADHQILAYGPNEIHEKRREALQDQLSEQVAMQEEEENWSDDGAGGNDDIWA